MTRSVEFGLGATFKEKHPDGTEIQRSAILAVGGTRNNKQAKMLPPEEKPVQPGVQTDYWANKRYGDKTQLPAPPSRRAGPLPYPQTYDDYLRDEQERNWSRSQ